MKKILLLALMISAVGLAALKDGTYSESLNEKKGETTWTSKIEIVVKSGKIVDVKLEGYSDKGLNKLTDEKYNEKWIKDKNMTFPRFVEAFKENLIKVQDPDKLDVVAGATGSSKSYKEMAKKALANAVK